MVIFQGKLNKIKIKISTMSLEGMKEYTSKVAETAITKAEYETTMLKLGSDNDAQSTLSEAYRLLGGIKEKVDRAPDVFKQKEYKDLFEKFKKEYDDVYKKINESYDSGIGISQAERFSIKLELLDLIELAKKNNIDEKERLRYNVSDKLRGVNIDKVQKEANDILYRDISDYSKSQALGVLDYLDKNFKPSLHTGEKVKKVTSQDSVFNHNLKVDGDEFKINSNPVLKYQQFYNPYLPYGLTSPSLIKGIDYKVSHNNNNDLSCPRGENSINSLLNDTFDYIIDSSNDALYGNNLNDVLNSGDIKERNVFQEKAIRKILGKGEDIDLKNEGFNNDYIVSYNHEKGNYLISPEEIKKSLENGNIEEIDSLGIANYLNFLEHKNGKIDLEVITNNFPGKALMNLGSLWNDEKVNDSYTGIAQKIIENMENGVEISNTIKKFKNFGSINDELAKIFKNELNKKNKEDKRVDIFLNFIEKNKLTFLNLYKKEIDKVSDILKKGKTEEEKIKIDEIFIELKTKLNHEVGKFDENGEEKTLDFKKLILESIVTINKLNPEDLEKLKSIPGINDIFETGMEVGKFQILDKINKLKTLLGNTINEYDNKEFKAQCTIDDIKNLKSGQQLVTKDQSELDLKAQNIENIKKEIQLTFQEYYKLNLDSKYLKILIENGSIFNVTSLEDIDKLIAEQNSKLKEAREDGIITSEQREVENANKQYISQVKENVDKGFISQAEALKELKSSGFSNNDIIYYSNIINQENNTTENNNNQNKQEKTQNNTQTNEQSSNTTKDLDFSTKDGNVKIVDSGSNLTIELNSSDDKKEIELSSDESEKYRENEQYRENFCNFIEKSNELGLNNFLPYRKEIFQKIDNIFGTTNKDDSEILNQRDFGVYLQSILKSNGSIEKIDPNQKYSNIENLIKKTNNGSDSNNDKNINEKGNTTLEQNFIDNYTNQGIFLGEKFEQSLKEAK